MVKQVLTKVKVSILQYKNTLLQIKVLLSKLKAAAMNSHIVLMLEPPVEKSRNVSPIDVTSQTKLSNNNFPPASFQLAYMLLTVTFCAKM